MNHLAEGLHNTTFFLNGGFWRLGRQLIDFDLEMRLRNYKSQNSLADYAVMENSALLLTASPCTIYKPRSLWAGIAGRGSCATWLFPWVSGRFHLASCCHFLKQLSETHWPVGSSLLLSCSLLKTDESFHSNCEPEMVTTDYFHLNQRWRPAAWGFIGTSTCMFSRVFTDKHMQTLRAGVPETVGY